MKFRRCVIAVLVGLLGAQFDPLVLADSTSSLMFPVSSEPKSPEPRPGPGQPAKTEASQTPAQTGNNLDDLKIVVLEGEDATNIIKKQTAVQPVVEVRDRNNLPVAGIEVLFTTPGFGPSGVFMNGTHSFSVVTDSAGRAAVTGMKPTGGSGSFKISVSAHGASHAGTATISQTNILKPAASSGHFSMTPSHLAIIAGAVGVAAAVGIVAGLNAGGSKPTGTIGTAGTPTISAPH